MAFVMKALMESTRLMSQTTKAIKTIPQTAFRRIRNTPSYFFLLWRWVSWLIALITMVSIHGQPNPILAIVLLVITFIQTLVVTLYAPVFQIFLPGLPGMGKIFQLGQQRVLKRQRTGKRHGRIQRPLATDEEADILTPLARTRNPYWDSAIYGIDVLICGTVTYLGGYFGIPHYGVASPFYRYGISTALAAAFAYRYRGALLAAVGYDLFNLLGAFFPPPGTPYYPLLARDLVGSLFDAPVIAILAAYLATLLASYTRSKRREQDTVRSQIALRKVGETLIQGFSDRQQLLQQSVEQMRKGGHFERLLIALIGKAHEGEDGTTLAAEIDTCTEAGFVEATIPDTSSSLFEHVLQTGEKYSAFEALHGEENSYGIARLYLPIFREGQPYLILGAESARQTPFERKQEEFLETTGTQLVVALENIRLTEQAAELAAATERGRIAREIHDGVAQLVYMFSLNTETCAALAHRLAEASDEDEDRELLTPLAERLDTLVTISKQALWETRQYMFTLKPLMSGSSTLTQMLTNQLREFEAISGLPVRLEVEGTEEAANGDQRQARKMVQVGTAIFRITQEALSNAYKHAGATQLEVHLRYLPQAVEIEICDNGKGLDATGRVDTVGEANHMSEAVTGEHQRIYSGHGMGGMRERAEELGGTFEVKRASTGGVSVRAILPK